MANQDKPSAFSQVKEGLTHFAKTEAELAKAEIMPIVKHAGLGGGLFGGAAVFGLHALWMLLLAAVLALGWLFDSITDWGPWGAFTLAFLVVAGLSLITAGILFAIGRSQLKQIEAPTATIEEAKATLGAIQDALKGRSQDELAAQPATHGASIRTGGAHVISADGIDEPAA